MKTNIAITMRCLLMCVGLLMIVFTLGCATSGRIGNLPIIPEGTEAVELVLVRPSSIVGAANSYYVAFNGNDIFSIKSGEHTIIKIPAGDHYVSVKCFGGWTPTWKQDAKPLSAIAGSRVFFKISPNMSCAEIEQLSSEAGEKILSRTTFVSANKLSDRS